MSKLRHANRDSKVQIAHPCAIFGVVVTAKDTKLTPSAHCNLLHKWHEVIWDTSGVFSNAATGMSTDRIEVSQQYSPPLWICSVKVPHDLFNKKLQDNAKQNFNISPKAVPGFYCRLICKEITL
jgi:hypothetical protein